MAMRPELLRTYYVVLALSNVVRGACIVAQAWTAILIGGGMATVGQLFVISHAVIVLAGPLAGVFIDRYSRRQLAIMGQLLIGIATFVPVAWAIAGWPLTMFPLVMVSLGSALGYLVMSGALDAIQQALGDRADQPRISAVAGSVRQGFVIAGSGAAGLGIHYLSPAAAYLFCAVFSIAAAALIFWLPAARIQSARRGNVFSEVASGLRELREMPVVLYVSLLTAIGFSVGQLSNVLLPSFVKDDLGGDSRLYGILDALWAVGGVAAALLAARYFRFRGFAHVEYFSAILLGLLTAALWAIDHPVPLMAAYLLLGSLFSITKVVCDGRILETCPDHVVGRVRTHVQSLISVSGLAIYLSPSVLPISDASGSYLVWGIVVVASASMLLWLDMRARSTIDGYPVEQVDE